MNEEEIAREVRKAFREFNAALLAASNAKLGVKFTVNGGWQSDLDCNECYRVTLESITKVTSY